MARRDRHGRGIRGPLAPKGSPLNVSRAQRFDTFVLEAFERIEARHPAAGVLDVVVADVPPKPAPNDGGRIQLGHTEPATRDRPARVVVHRRPIEVRCDGALELGAVIADVVAELVAESLGLAPEDVDPDYGV